MKILLINPPFVTMTSRLGVGHQIPLGLLMVGGPLVHAGHEVRLLDAERRHLKIPKVVDEVRRFQPDIVMTGHAGSTPAHPVCVRMLRAIKSAFPEVATIYGGVFPTYHFEDILSEEACVDFIIVGEGEATALDLVTCLASLQRESRAIRSTGDNLTSILRSIPGIAFTEDGTVVCTPERPPIRDLDTFRIGWELIDNWDDYKCFGLGRAAIVQYSRGCPHPCTYCGQSGFWMKWRRRSVVSFVDEVEWLYRTHNIIFFTIADENPTTLRDEWKQLLEELVSRNLPIYFFATIRATDIVRDADILDLYRRAGLLYVLMGIESTSPEVIEHIRKGSTTREDYKVCQLLRKHGIYSIMGLIVGLGEETPESFGHALQQLTEYDGDLLNAMYVTPHRWTGFAHECRNREVVQLDQSKWDYRHQILGQEHMTPARFFFAVKWLELRYHLRLKRLKDFLWDTRDSFNLWQKTWCLMHTSLVWFGEIAEFFLSTSFARDRISLLEVQGQPQSPRSLPKSAAACKTTPDSAQLVTIETSLAVGAARGVRSIFMV